jgi:AcrR family transcriptional regulator
MGNRDDLLRGARECLVELGYARSTAREIAARSGTSLAAIGYHFGSTEALLHAAITDGFREWRASFAGAVEQAGQDGGDALAAIGRQLDRLFEEQRSLFVVFLEAIALADRDPDAVAGASAGYREDREAIAGLVALVRGSSRRDDGLLASTLLAVVDGLFVQHVLDPEGAPRPSAVLELFAPLLAPARRRRP